jgi:hypothetical protein
VPDYVYFDDAATTLGISIRTLRRRMRAKKVRMKKVSAKSKDGRALPRAYVPQSFVDRCKAEAEADTDTDKITVREGGKILKIKPMGVHSLIHLGRLTAETGKPICKAGYKREGLVLSRVEVEERRDKQRAKFGAKAKRTRREFDKSILREILADKKPHLRSEVLEQADARGVPYGRVYQARKKLKVRSERLNGQAHWRLPGGLSAEQIRREFAESTLSEILADKKPHLRSEVVKQADARGVHYVLLCGARKKLRLQTEKTARVPNKAGGPPVTWRLPGVMASETPTAPPIADPAAGNGPAATAVNGNGQHSPMPVAFTEYAHLRIEVALVEKTIRGKTTRGRQKEIRFEANGVQWPILEAALAADPSEFTWDKVKFPGTLSKEATYNALARLNDNLRIVGLEIRKRKLSVIGKKSGNG